MKAEPGRSVAVAIWLLQHLGGKASEDALIGDLLERMAEGQTAGWLWREVLMALVVGVWKEMLAQWQTIGLVAIGTSITLWCGNAPWRRQWVDFVWSSVAEHHPRWALFTGHAFAIEATYGTALAMLGLLVIFTSRRMPAWGWIVQAIPISYLLLTQALTTFLLIGDPASSFFDIRHFFILGCNAGTLFLASLMPIGISVRPHGRAAIHNEEVART